MHKSDSLTYTDAWGFFFEKSHAKPRSDIRTWPCSSRRMFAGYTETIENNKDNEVNWVISSSPLNLCRRQNAGACAPDRGWPLLRRISSHVRWKLRADWGGSEGRRRSSGRVWSTACQAFGRRRSCRRWRDSPLRWTPDWASHVRSAPTSLPVSFWCAFYRDTSLRTFSLCRPSDSRTPRQSLLCQWFGAR